MSVWNHRLTALFGLTGNRCMSLSFEVEESPLYFSELSGKKKIKTCRALYKMRHLAFVKRTELAHAELLTPNNYSHFFHSPFLSFLALSLSNLRLSFSTLHLVFTAFNLLDFLSFLPFICTLIFFYFFIFPPIISSSSLSLPLTLSLSCPSHCIFMSWETVCY